MPCCLQDFILSDKDEIKKEKQFDMFGVKTQAFNLGVTSHWSPSAVSGAQPGSLSDDFNTQNIRITTLFPGSAQCNGNTKPNRVSSWKEAEQPVPLLSRMAA